MAVVVVVVFVVVFVVVIFVIVVVYSRNLPLCYVKIRFFIDEMLLMMLLALL